jgi:hypothetical protein
MACRADRMGWRDAAPRFGATSARWPGHGLQPQPSRVSAEAIIARLRDALAPADAHAVSAGILDRLREHDYLPPDPPVALP